MSNYLSNIVEFGRNNVHESSNLKEQHVEDSTFHGHCILFYPNSANRPKSNLNSYQS